MDDLVTIASSPDGRQFAIFTAPPGSGLDDDGVLRGGMLGLLIGVIKAGRRAGSGRWRIVVQERAPNGRLGPALKQVSLGSEAQAQARVHELVRLIQAGKSIA